MNILWFIVYIIFMIVVLKIWGPWVFKLFCRSSWVDEKPAPTCIDYTEIHKRRHKASMQATALIREAMTADKVHLEFYANAIGITIDELIELRKGGDTTRYYRVLGKITANILLSNG